VELPIAPVPPDFPFVSSRTPVPRPKAVLVADPDSSARHIAARYLAEAGFAVDTFATASDTREAIGARRWDAVLLDLGLPAGGGLLLYAHIRERDPALASHVVFTSAGPVDPALRAELEATGRPWVAKPFDVPLLPSLLFGGLPA
jgi:DNA-binding response OmpR family regulator